MMNRWILPFFAVFAVAGCGGDDIVAPGVVEQAVAPCNQGMPAFDVWQADFAPQFRTKISGFVDTGDSDTAAEFRLRVACQGEIVVDTFGGMDCSHQAPKIAEGADPACPSFSINVEDIDFDTRIECFAEIGTTEPLEIGTGGCRDAEIARYRFGMAMDSDALGLDLVLDNCRDDEGCLEDLGIEAE